jgi:hypothetical protein
MSQKRDSLLNVANKRVVFEAVSCVSVKLEFIIISHFFKKFL